ncbi:hypothetical protein [Marivita sp. S2033]|uniref:hypothetical protein n=1 Tax=Marivita sp. S2033 TaxID=3373187 RepID=UPI0039821AD9
MSDMTGLLELLVDLQMIAVAGFTAFTPIVDVDEPPQCENIVVAQMAPLQDGVPQQQWCCCGSCCNWAISCDAIPGCGSC